MVIAATTRRLAGEQFEYQAIEPTALKGFAEPVGAWRVVRERTIASRFETLRAPGLTPLVGREEELELLTRRWAQIKDGEGRVILLSGEPGIGKSRLTAALENNLKGDTHICLRYFCQPHHQGSALQPVLAQFPHAAGFDSTIRRRRGAQSWKSSWAKQAPAPRSRRSRMLLGTATARGRRHGPAAHPARRTRRIDPAPEALTKQSPVLMLFEDAHWADPTSIELLTLTIERMQTLPVLLVISFRPDYQPPWTGLSHVTALALNRLGRRKRAKLVEHITGGKSLPPELLEKIVDRTDGVPLFVEELTKALLESEQLHEDPDRYVLEQPMQQLAIPTTLQDSLMARVDRLGSAREVLQIGAAIGREFSYEVLAAVAGLPDVVLQDALIRLTEAELLSLRGTPPNAVYSFKHALVQDAAYSAMLRARRQQLHSAIALVLEKRFPDVVKSNPELVAQQFERAGQERKGNRVLIRQAADHDLRRFAMKGIDCALFQCTASGYGAAADARSETSWSSASAWAWASRKSSRWVRPPRKRWRITVGPWSSAAPWPNRGRERFLAAWGIWFNATTAGRGADATKLADELVSIARELDNPDLLLEAYHAKIPMQVRLADFSGIVETAAKEVIRLYDRKRHRDHAYYFGGHNSRMCAQGFYAFGLWGQGLLDQAQRMSWRAVEDARELGHVLSLAHALQRTGHDNDAPEGRANPAVSSPMSFIRSPNATSFPGSLPMRSFFRGWLAALAGEFAPESSRCCTPSTSRSPRAFGRSSCPVLPSKNCARDMPIGRDGDD